MFRWMAVATAALDRSTTPIFDDAAIEMTDAEIERLKAAIKAAPEPVDGAIDRRVPRRARHSPRQHLDAAHNA